jgi:hypothetical protein
LYRLVPHRSKFRRANELFESNIHADQLAVADDDESLHSYTSDSFRGYLSRQNSEQFSVQSAPASSPALRPQLVSQFSLPLSSHASSSTSESTAPIVVPRQTRFSCSNPLYQAKDDFWIDPAGAAGGTTPLAQIESSSHARSSTSASTTPKNALVGVYDNLKSYLRKKSIFSDPFSSEETDPPASLSFSTPTRPSDSLPAMNLEQVNPSSSSSQRRPKRGSKDDLEIERITSLRLISAAHLRQVNLSAAPHRRTKKAD